MGSHSVTCHPAEVTFPPLPQPKLVLDLATPEGCKAELTCKWQWHQLGRMQVCTLLQTDNHTSTPPLSFFTEWMPFLMPNQQHQSADPCTSTKIKGQLAQEIRVKTNGWMDTTDCSTLPTNVVGNEITQSSNVNHQPLSPTGHIYLHQTPKERVIVDLLIC